MNKTIEIAAMILGGVSLFAMCFLGFAVVANVPLYDVAVIGKLFPEPEVNEEPADGGDGGTGTPSQPTYRPDSQLLAANMGVLSTWKLDSPFTQGELKALVEELKLKQVQLDQRIREMAQRELEADQREESVAERFAALEELRLELERYEERLIQREAEVNRDEGAAQEFEDQRWAGLAKLLAAQETSVAGPRLRRYSPEEAAKILRAMDDKYAAKLLNSFEGDAFLEYGEAYVRTPSSGD